MNLENELGRMNEQYFFREFTFSKTTFCPAPDMQVELADSIVSVGDILFVYQAKERERQAAATSESEKRWFDKKVLDKATKQIRDTMRYLSQHEEIALANHRGHKINLKPSGLAQVHKLIVYDNNPLLPEDCRRLKHHPSKTAGIIHLFSAPDYHGVIQTLATPFEVAEYLQFRTELIARWDQQLPSLPEQALVGQYVVGDINRRPSIEFASVLANLNQDRTKWDLSRYLHVFGDRITTVHGKNTDYYAILRELALLHRSDLRYFKERFDLLRTDAEKTGLILPYRMVVPRTQCGFVFTPVTKETYPHRINFLKNMTLLHKHDRTLSKCIGVSLAVDDKPGYLVEWCYLDYPWAPDEELDRKLKESNPFRDVMEQIVPRYPGNT